jgi:sugar phosphate isomerase/epimerase
VATALENMPPQGVYFPRYSDFSGLFELLEEVEFLGVTLDVGHAHLARVPLPAVVQQLGQRLRHVHVHDNDGSGDQHMAVGHGTVDWTGLIKALVQIRYAGFWELEFQGQGNQVASIRYLEKLAEAVSGGI